MLKARVDGNLSCYVYVRKWSNFKNRWPNHSRL